MANRGPRFYLDELRRAVLDAPAKTAPALRAAVAAGREVPADLAPVVAKIRASAYKVTDDDIAALRKAGRSEDEIFELTCAAAVGVSLDRCNKALAACGLAPAPGHED